MAPEQTRLDRLNAGAPFLKVHEAHDLDTVIGSVVRGSRTDRASRETGSPSAIPSATSGATSKPGTSATGRLFGCLV